MCDKQCILFIIKTQMFPKALATGTRTSPLIPARFLLKGESEQDFFIKPKGLVKTSPVICPHIYVHNTEGALYMRHACVCARLFMQACMHA